MIEKYEDLADRIAEDFPPMTGPDIATLRWLDAHPDQAPGRTITESEFKAGFGIYSEPWAREVLIGFGITVVPDPEPTNAEKIEQLLWSINKEHEGECLEGEAAVRAWSEALDEAGVKAPGGDDD